mgnify:FL=1
MIGSLVLIASTVLGIFIYVLTLQKRPVIGILKARGVPTGYLAGSGCAQTLVLSGAGIAIGSLLALGTSLLLPGTVPFRSSGPLYALIAIAFVAVSVAGGLISVRKVTDPSNPRGGTELATSALSPSTTITLPEPVSTDSIALVFRQMPKAQDGRNWAWVSELTVN